MSRARAYRSQLLLFLLVFVLLPISAALTYLFFQFYRVDADRAHFAVEQKAATLASRYKAALTELQFNSLGLANNRALAEGTTNILYSQYVNRRLQAFHEDNPVVKAVFIVDEGGYVLEAYPFDALRVDPERLRELTQQIMASSSRESLPKLLHLPAQLFDDAFAVEERAPENLLYVMPVFKQLPSIVEPWRVTAAMYVLIDHAVLLRNEDSSDVSTSQDMEWRAGGGVVLKSNGSMAAIPAQAEAVLTEVFDKSLSTPGELRMVLTDDQSVYMQPFWNNFVIQLAVLLMVFAVSIGFVVFVSRKLQAPIEILLNIGRRIRDGDYRITEQQSEYTEFNTVIESFQKMARQIESQIETLKTERDRAESSEKAKAQFLANMSHEIRTPMNGVLGMMQVLDNESLTEKQHYLLQQAMHSAKQLLTIIDDILDFSKIEAGKLLIESTAFDLVKTLEQSIAPFTKQVDDKGIRLEVSIGPELTGTWLGDPTRISQIVINLLSNAIKFTEHGSVSLGAGINGEIDGLAEVAIEVEDTGIGIADDSLANLFSAFTQADESTTRRFGGTGLGLSISKRLAQMMGGDLSVRSEEGQGSCFTLNLYCQHIDHAESDMHETEATTDIPDLQGKTVLIAEDNRLNREILEFMLEETGASLVFAENGAEAVAAFGRQKPAIVLMDAQMPVMDGLEATEAIRKLDTDVPIVMQTANVMTQDRDSYQRLGANDCLSKPIDEAELYRLMQRFLCS